MTRLFQGALLILVSVVLLSACSANIKEEQQAANDKVTNAFNSPTKKANHKAKDIHFYLPFGYEIKEKKQNNIIIKNGSKLYILFYNPHEGPASNVVYKAALSTKKYDYEKTYKKDGQFGYLLVRKLDEEKQEVTVGLGGVKMTTEVKIKSTKNDAEAMMNIVKSVTFVKQKPKK